MGGALANDEGSLMAESCLGQDDDCVGLSGLVMLTVGAAIRTRDKELSAVGEEICALMGVQWQSLAMLAEMMSGLPTRN